MDFFIFKKKKNLGPFFAQKSVGWRSKLEVGLHSGPYLLVSIIKFLEFELSHKLGFEFVTIWIFFTFVLIFVVVVFTTESLCMRCSIPLYIGLPPSPLVRKNQKKSLPPFPLARIFLNTSRNKINKTFLQKIKI